MKITMTQSMTGSANQYGNASMEYAEGQQYDMDQPWQQSLAQVFIDNGWSTTKGGKKEVKVDSPTEAKSEPKKKRASKKA